MNLRALAPGLYDNGQCFLVGVILLCLLVVWVISRANFKQLVADIIRDKDTKHVVARDLFKALAFGLASLFSSAVVLANLVFQRDASGAVIEIIITLLLYSGGLQYLKARQMAAAGIQSTGSAEPPPPAGQPPGQPYPLP